MGRRRSSSTTVAQRDKRAQAKLPPPLPYRWLYRVGSKKSAHWRSHRQWTTAVVKRLSRCPFFLVTVLRAMSVLQNLFSREVPQKQLCPRIFRAKNARRRSPNPRNERFDLRRRRQLLPFVLFVKKIELACLKAANVVVCTNLSVDVDHGR